VLLVSNPKLLGIGINFLFSLASFDKKHTRAFEKRFIREREKERERERERESFSCSSSSSFFLSLSRERR
jgi:hypothetical protein